MSGMTFHAPTITLARMSEEAPKLRWYWCPMFHMPNNRQGTMATMTKNMVRLRSMPSRMWAPECVTCPGVKANVSKESNTTQKRDSLPPSSK